MELDARLPLVLLSLIPVVQAARAQGAGKEEDALIEKHVAALRATVAGPAEAPRAKVLLLGTFHFDDKGLDAHKPKYRFDVFSEEGQRQLGEVLDRLAEYAPTKVLVEQESAEQERVNRWYASYLAGKETGVANEIVTVGFALAKRLGHAKVHAFDAAAEWLTTAPDSEEALRQEAERIGMEALLEDPVLRSYSASASQMDEILETLTLRQRFRLLNHEGSLRLSHGAYFFFASFRISDGAAFPGPDGFASAWHNRNLRMFSTIQRLASAPDDRLLVLVGAGHVPILQHCVQSCPTMKWIPVDEYLRPR